MQLAPLHLEQWDPDFRAYLSHLDARKPVVVGGDLNVGHLDLDIYNVSAAHIKKTSGLTPQERASWTETLATAGEVGLYKLNILRLVAEVRCSKTTHTVESS
jgi:exonuclease III